jgi:heme/copper-type cytochrome/quinol oxidase subunit 2
MEIVFEKIILIWGGVPKKLLVFWVFFTLAGVYFFKYLYPYVNIKEYIYSFAFFVFIILMVVWFFIIGLKNIFLILCRRYQFCNKRED